jgi:hypothetical protein
MKSAAFGIAALAAIIAVVPQLTDCGESMRCHWTAQASIAVGIPMAASGVLAAFGRSKAARRSLAVVGSIMGACSILLPTSLIGVCASDMMLCNLVMKPTLILSGMLVIALCAVMVLGSSGREAHA